MKKKFNFWLQLVTICLCICAIAVGVYSATTASVTAGGKVAFSAHNCKVEVTGYIYGHGATLTDGVYVDDEDGLPVAKEDAEYLTANNTPQEVIGENNVLGLGTRYFTDMASQTGEPEDIYVVLQISNASTHYRVKATVDTTNLTFGKITATVEPASAMLDTAGTAVEFKFKLELQPDEVGGNHYSSLTGLTSVSINMTFTKDETASLDSDGYYNDIKYTPNNDGKTAYVSGFKTGITQADIEPAVAYNNTIYTVTTIGDSAFEGCSSLVSVVIPNTVTAIEDSAFYDSYKVTDISIPDSIEFVGSDALNWFGLEAYTIENDGFLYLGNDENPYLILVWYVSDYDKDNSDELKINEQTKIIHSGSLFNFFGAIWAEELSVRIPDSVTFIGDATFNNSVVNNLIMSDSVTHIGARAFDGCSMTSISLPNSLSYIGASAFSNCNKLSSVTIGSGVKTISEYAFYESGLTELNIPNNVEVIKECAFYSCSELVDLTIGSGVKTIESEAFVDCSSLESITINNNNYYDSRNNCNAIIETATNTLLVGCKATSIPNTVTKIGDSAFYGCVALESIVIPDNIISIGDSAFFYCDSLASVKIGKNVESIGDSAFSCSKLKTVKIDSQDVVNLITNISAAGDLIYRAEYIYIKSDLTLTSFLSNTEQYRTDGTVDPEGYIFYDPLITMV